MTSLAQNPDLKAAALVCPECGAAMVLRRTAKFKWRDGVGRLFYGCSRWPACDATHGAHPDGRPLGIPADKATKQARTLAHAAFDSLREKRGWVGGHKETHGAYVWLGRKLGIPETEIKEKCHVAMFDSATCARVVEICEAAKLR